jgi:hypothetical protein
VIQLHWAQRWQRLRSSLLLSVIVGAVLTIVSVYALIIAFALPDGDLYDINEIYEVFPFGRRCCCSGACGCSWIIGRRLIAIAPRGLPGGLARW